MKATRTIICLFLSLAPVAAMAQAIDNTLAYKNISSDKYFRLNYENDFFAAKDEYYTQGVAIELVAPWVKYSPLSRTLVHLSNAYTRYGMGIEHNGYTPLSISSDAVIPNDRPFAATLFLKTFQVSIDTTRKQRLSTTLSTGVIGPAAGGKEMQTYIHQELNNIVPHGWDNQVRNDLILNYQVNYEKQLLAYRNYFSLSGSAMARVGTLSDKAGIGATLMAGYFDDPFSSTTARGSNFRIYAYERPELFAVGYDATLQGGLINRNTPYTIPGGNICRTNFQNRFGVVITYQRLYLEYFRTSIGREFTTGERHNWGGIQIAFGL